MHEWMSMVSPAVLGVWQEGGELPTNVPGIDGGGGGAVDGQGAPGTGQPGTGTAPAQPGFFNPMFLIVILMLVFLIFTSVSSSRREKKRMAAMLAGLKRGDRVQTLAGMIGTVHEIRDDSIVLRVDDVTGAKIHFARNAVQHVIKSARGDGKGGEAEDAG